MKLGIAYALTLSACLSPAFACTHAPSPTSEPRMEDAAGLDTSGASVCAHLAAIGCSTGNKPECAATIDRVVADRITLLPVACWLRAADVPSAQACGVKVCE